METRTLEAPDISCEHCLQKIQETVEKLPGVKFVSGDTVTRIVVVEYDDSKADVDLIERAMEDEGYPVKK
ncbi:MAG: cation transporter [Chloroflexota bacterium]